LMDFRDLAALLGEIIDVAMKVTAADMGNIQLVEGGVLKIISQRGFDTDFLEFFNRVEDSSSACGSAMESGQRVIIEDVTNSPIFAGTPALTAMLRAGARAVQSTPLLTRGGELIGMLSTHYKSVHRPSGRDLRFLDILARQTADIIERQRAERALRTSEERLRLAQKAAKVGVFEWDIQTGVNTWSPELEELYGLEHGSFGGTQPAWESLVHPEDRELAVKKVEEGFRTGMPMEAEWRVIWPDGSIHWLAGKFQVYRNAQGIPTRMSGVNFEITERKRMETELRRANHDLEQFAYSASHDLQEPLRSVKIFSELLSSRHGTQLDNEALEFLNNVRDGARRMEMLVRDLLAYSQASTSENATAVVDANAAMEAAIANLAGAIAETDAKVDFDPLPSVRVQSIHLQQVFQNLIGNAIKYRRSGVSPVVHTKVQREGEDWHFSISDNGIGIEPQFQEKIFGLFKRLHTGDEYSGTGIGLALCQRIVERHHGRIWVESELGKGSVFHFTFPV
jgi:PAS domain S-box-containing protein